MFLLSCRIFHGRDPCLNDIIRTEEHKFETEEKLNKWITKTFTEKSVFWIDYTIKHNGVITTKINNANLFFDGKTHRENR